MNLERKGKALAIFLGDADRIHGKSAYAYIVEKAREFGMAGATVTHGQMGFGGNSRIHTASILRLSEDLPVKVEIFDTPERIDAFLAMVHDDLSDGIVVTWDVEIERYRHEGNKPG
jgi:PII-like signaling protein